MSRRSTVLTGTSRARRGLTVLLLALAARVIHAAPADPAESGTAAAAWIQSPYRHFGPGQPVAAGRAVLYDEASDPALKSGLDGEIARLENDLYGRQGWRNPFSSDEPLRVYVARGESGGVRELTARAIEKGQWVSPAVLLDASGQSSGDIVREVGRQVARATLRAYGTDDKFLGAALAEHLSAPAADASSEEIWIAAAAGEVDFRSKPEALGRLWVDEIVRTPRGPQLLREAWERAADLGEPPMPVLLRALVEESSVGEDAVLLRAAARLYAAIEPDAAPSKLRLLDVESGAVDAAAPASLAVRHRTLLPDTEQSLRVSWPPDGGAGAAIVRYRDTALPPDVVFFAAGERRTIPLAGVARVDWLVAGNASGGGSVKAPAYAELSDAVPYAGLDAKADGASSGGPRLTWTTESHEGLAGWAVFREEVLSDGRIARTGPEIVPSAESATRSYRYEFVDPSSRSGTYYRYTVWAVTSDGLLGRAFSATVKTSD
ncbi:MAG TPA: hypothetical protein VKG23_12710 [Thermoanaerobaculia bacterium]|nr:hypothetical protein [Thermoanaerobaculia bacterium]